MIACLKRIVLAKGNCDLVVLIFFVLLGNCSGGRVIGVLIFGNMFLWIIRKIEVKLTFNIIIDVIIN